MSTHIQTGELRRALVALAAALCLAPAVHAQSIDLILSNPNQTVTAGTGSVGFDATLFNPSAATLYLNGDSFTTSSTSLQVDDSPFFANAPLFLAPGASSGPFLLFNVDLSASTLPGIYAANTFSILGGADGGAFTAFQDLADGEFSVTVTPAQMAAAPEVDPSSAVVALTFLTGMIAVLRARSASPSDPSADR